MKPFIASRRARPRRRAAVVLTGLLGATSIGCQTPEPAGHGSSAREPSGPVVIMYSADMASVNELTTNNTALHTALHYYMLFLPLLEEQTDWRDGPASFKPRLASGWTFSDDRLTLTFDLRTDAVWSDGVPITAEDVRWTWMAQIDPDVAWEVVEDKAAIRDVEVVDEHTVRFHFTHAYANQLVDAVQGVILPKHAWSELPFDQWHGNPDWFVEHLVVDGPYMLERWDRNERIVLRRNERGFADPLPDIERIVFEITPDEDTRAAQLRAGSAHAMEAQFGKAVQLRDDAELEVITYDHRQNVFVTWNIARPLFSDARVRRALTLGIDRQAIIDTLCFGFAVPTASPLLAGAWAYNRDLEPLAYDPEAARALLSEAGWTDTDGDGIVDRNGQPFRFTLATNPDNTTRREMLPMIQDQLRRIGIDVQPETIEFNTLVKRGYDHDFDAIIMGLGLDTSFDLTGTLHSKSIDEGLNWGSYSNPRVDQLLDEIKRFVDPFEAKPLFDELQVLVQQDQPNTLIYQPKRIVITRGLQDVKPNAMTPYANIRAWKRSAN